MFLDFSDVKVVGESFGSWHPQVVERLLWIQEAFLKEDLKRRELEEKEKERKKQQEEAAARMRRVASSRPGQPVPD